MKNPRIIGITLRRSGVVCPARVVFQIIIIPAFQVERRICHDIVKIQTFVQVVGESGIAFRTQIMADATQSEVHLCQTIGGSLLLLSIYIDTTDVTLFGFHQVGALNEHTARTTAWVVQCAIKRLNNSSDKLNNIMRCIELTFLFRGINGKLFQEILIYATYQVFLFTKRLVADFVDLIHNLLHVIGSKIALGERTFHETALQRGVRFADTAQSSVKCHIQLRCSRVDDS